MFMARWFRRASELRASPRQALEPGNCVLMESMESTTEKPTTEYVAPAARSGGCVRSEAPVFVLGCPRSGTTVLFHMLLSAGNFAVYRAESNVFNLLVPRFGGMRSARDRNGLMK